MSTTYVVAGTLKTAIGERSVLNLVARDENNNPVISFKPGFKITDNQFEAVIEREGNTPKYTISVRAIPEKVLVNTYQVSLFLKVMTSTRKPDYGTQSRMAPPPIRTVDTGEVTITIGTSNGSILVTVPYDDSDELIPSNVVVNP